jgi:single-stranded DNA-binding protein
VWGKLAPIVAQLDKGQRVTIDGRPNMRSWTARDGSEREEMEIDVDACSWDARRSEAPRAQRDEPPPPDDDDDIGF